MNGAARGKLLLFCLSDLDVFVAVAITRFYVLFE